MHAQPMRRYREPRYPTAGVLDAHPELLRLLPRRWRSSSLVLTGLAATGGLVLAGCRPSWADTFTGELKVAPIFAHGDGRGAFGCVAVNPPVFLSEEEARAVIVEEAKAAGVTFEADVLTLPEVEIPRTTENGSVLPDEGEEARTKARELKLDGTDRERRISFEYVSHDDFEAWKADDGGPMSTVSSFDLIGTAKVLRQGLTTAPAERDGTAGVFYDPMERYLESSEDLAGGVDWEQAEKDARERAKAELREQVKDFVHWLKTEGVI